MSEQKFLNNYESKIEKMSNINQSSELTGQDSAKKSEHQVFFSSESQKKEYNLTQKEKDVFTKVVEKGNKSFEIKEEEAEGAGVPGNVENLEILNENIGEIGEPLFDDYMNDMLQNREFSLNDAVEYSELQDASKILSNNEKYNIQYNENNENNENSFNANSNGTKYIFRGFKDP